MLYFVRETQLLSRTISRTEFLRPHPFSDCLFVFCSQYLETLISHLIPYLLHLIFLFSGLKSMRICTVSYRSRPNAADSNSACVQLRRLIRRTKRATYESRPHYATDNYESLITPHLEHARENKTFRRLLPDALSISRQINVS